MSSLDQQINAGATDSKKQVSEFDRWKETATSLAPLLFLALIFIAAWSAAPTLEFFQAHLEALQEHGNFDEVTPFYLGSYVFQVIVIAVYVCTLQYLANPDVYNRNERNFLLISVLLAVIMFLAIFVNTVGISVDFGWPFSIRQKVIGWFSIVAAVLITVLGISYLAKRIPGGDRGLPLYNPVAQWIVATDTRRVCCALVVALGAFLVL
jgi:hypothetical protein